MIRIHIPRKGDMNLTLGGIDLNNYGSVLGWAEKKLLTVLFPDGRACTSHGPFTPGCKHMFATATFCRVATADFNAWPKHTFHYRNISSLLQTRCRKHVLPTQLPTNQRASILKLFYFLMNSTTFVGCP